MGGRATTSTFATNCSNGLFESGSVVVKQIIPNDRCSVFGYYLQRPPIPSFKFQMSILNGTPSSSIRGDALEVIRFGSRSIFTPLLDRYSDSMRADDHCQCL